MRKFCATIESAHEPLLAAVELFDLFDGKECGKYRRRDENPSRIH